MPEGQHDGLTPEDMHICGGGFPSISPDARVQQIKYLGPPPLLLLRWLQQQVLQLRQRGVVQKWAVVGDVKR